MKVSTRFTCIFVGLTILCLVGSGPSQGSVDEKRGGEKEKIVSPTEEQKTTFINLYSWATILPKELIDLKNIIVKGNNFEFSFILF